MGITYHEDKPPPVQPLRSLRRDDGTSVVLFTRNATAEEVALYAAAPDLLAALNLLLDRYTFHEQDEETARAAVAKATLSRATPAARGGGAS